MDMLHFFKGWSLKHKLMILMTLAALLPVSLLSWFQYDRLIFEIKKNIHSTMTLEVATVIDAIHAFLSTASNDSLYLTHFQSLQLLLSPSASQAPGTASAMQETIHAFEAIMQAKNNYMQVRVIDMNGQEIVRVDRNAVAAPLHVVRGSNLQNKRNADYVRNALDLTGEHEYISPMNLNREHGEIQQPHVPVMRFVRLIENAKGQRIGMVVINVFTQPVLDMLAQEINKDKETTDSFYLLNEDGFYLYHHSQNKRFGFDLGNSNTIIEKEPELWDSIQSQGNGFVMIGDSYNLYRKIQMLQQKNSRNWYLVHKVNRQEVFAELYMFEKQVLIGILVLLLLMGWMIRKFIARIVDPIAAVTRRMQKLAKGDLNNKAIHYKGEDEISRMIKASAAMQLVQNNIANVAEKISKGDFRSDLKPQSEQDKMGHALQRMTLRLRQTTALTEAVAAGDLSCEFEIMGSNDQLGYAIQQLIENLQQINSHAIEISQGDFRRDYQPRSEHDTLGLAIQEMIRRLRQAAETAAAIATGEYNREVACQGEFDQLGRSLQFMMQALTAAARESADQDWLKSGLAKIAMDMQAQKTQEQLAETMLDGIVPILNALHGSFYTWNQQSGCLQLKGQYACGDGILKTVIKAGEGLTGQCALDKKINVVEDIPADYMPVQSSIGSTAPTMLIEVPLLADGVLTGVMELAGISPLTMIQRTMLEQLSPLLGMAVHVLQQNRNTEKLLEESQALGEELQAQEEELREANTTLVARAEELSTSEEELQAQQEELRQSNDELVAQNKMVEAQKQDLIESAESLTKQAQQLQQASQYKSDFLSNMSHELRTPLNSLLILSDMLANNKDKNLSDKQVKFAQTIHASGVDLLELINDILDLAKVEAGKMILDPHRFPVLDISDAMQQDFTHIAEQNAVTLRITLDDDLPEFIFSDQMRIKQVLKNLLSNAFKFTQLGEVSLQIGRVDNNLLSFTVSDSGVGIATDKLHDIFEAFQQEDGSTSRKYGGTGLGLSICRELAKLLGGYITVQSERGKGSTFAMIIPHSMDGERLGGEQLNGELLNAAPVNMDIGGAESKPIMPAKTRIVALPAIRKNEPDVDITDKPSDDRLPNPMADDREQIKPQDRTILIVEDDENFAAIQQSLVQEHGFKAINAMHGDHGLMLAQQYLPDAILLDLQLPVLDGMSVLDRLKQHPGLRHIPVHVISCMDNTMEKHVLKAGALSFVRKPAKKEQLDHVLNEIGDFLQRDIKRLLIVEDDEKQMEALKHLLDANDVDVMTASSGKATLALLRENYVDCMILDLTLPDMSGEAVLETIEREKSTINQGHVLPVIVHTSKDLSEAEVEKLQGMSKSIIIKGSYSPDRLLAETSLFLHQMEENISSDKQGRIDKIRQQDVDLDGNVVLLVDDDIRNIYSLSSYLESHGIIVHTARNGLESLSALKQHGDAVDLILMDIMMPEMDGYEAMKEIRNIHAYKNLPIIALTAKAMKGDREQCIVAGASDYITKPVDTDKLISLMRVWLHE